VSIASRRVLAPLLAIGAAGLATASYVAVGPPAVAKAASTTQTVGKGTVMSSVTATGNVSPSTQLNINFTTAGVVTEVDVKPGQVVKKGQVVAKVDPGNLQYALDAAKQKLAQLRAGGTAPTKAADAISITQAQAAVDNANTALANAQASASLDVTTSQAAVDQAKANLADVQATVAQDAVNLQAAVDQAQATASAQITADQSTLSADQIQLTIDTSSAALLSVNTTQRQQADIKVFNDQAKVASDQLKLTNDQNAVTTATNNQTAGKIKDQQSINQSTNALTNAQNSQQASSLKDQQAITNAQTQVASAKLSLQAAQVNLTSKEQTAPADLTTQLGAVASAQAAFDGTVLIAPVDGTVAAVNGKVGQNSSTQLQTSTTGTGGSSTASTGFVVLTDLSTLQVTTGYSETDASKLQTGDAAIVTFDALPGQSLAGTVTNIDTNSTVVSNVVTYNVTVSINGAPRTLRPGMTASVAVTYSHKDNVLTLPTSAVPTRGTNTTLQVLQADGKTTVPKQVTVGMRGDDTVEIISGLAQGDKVVITAARSITGGANNQIRIPGGVGGGGAGGAIRIGG
jgi:multidrug efflux pump subunit AcrA (membrane-fusion protein)